MANVTTARTMARVAASMATTTTRRATRATTTRRTAVTAAAMTTTGTTTTTTTTRAMGAGGRRGRDGGGFAFAQRSVRAFAGKSSENRGKSKTATEGAGADDGEAVLDEDFDVEEEVRADEEGEEDGDAIDTAGTEYGEMALDALRQALEGDGLRDEYDIFSFRVNTARRRVLVSVDKLNDKFGSPTLDELTAIVRAHNAILDERGFPDDVAVEVASPGATRKLRVPSDLKRFRELVMDVTYKGEAEDPSSTANVTKTMEITDITDSEVEWKLADVPANRPAKKGMGMNKKSREWRLRMPLEAVIRANLFIDI